MWQSRRYVGNDGAAVRLWDETGQAGALYWQYAITQWGNRSGTSTELDQGYVANGGYRQFELSSESLNGTYDARLQGDFIFKSTGETVTVALHASELDNVGDAGTASTWAARPAMRLP